MNKTLGSIFLTISMALYPMRASCLPTAQEQNQLLNPIEELQLSIYRQTQSMLIQRQCQLLDAFESQFHVKRLSPSIATTLTRAIESSLQYARIQILIPNAETLVTQQEKKADELTHETNLKIQDLISECDKYTQLTDAIWTSMSIYKDELEEHKKTANADPQSDAIIQYLKFILDEATLEECQQQKIYIMNLPILEKTEAGDFKEAPIKLPVSLKPVLEKSLINYEEYIQYLQTQYTKALQQNQKTQADMLDSMIKKMQAPGINYFMVKRLLLPNMRNFIAPSMGCIQNSDKIEEISQAIKIYIERSTIIQAEIGSANSKINSLAQEMLNEDAIMKVIEKILDPTSNKELFDLAGKQLEVRNANEYSKLHGALISEFYKKQIQRMITEANDALQLIENGISQRQEDILKPIADALQKQKKLWQDSENTTDATDSQEPFENDGQKIAKLSLLSLASVVSWNYQNIAEEINSNVDLNLTKKTAQLTLTDCIEMFFKKLTNPTNYTECIQIIYFIVHGMDKQQIQNYYEIFKPNETLPFAILRDDDCKTPSHLLAKILVKLYHFQDTLYTDARKEAEKDAEYQTNHEDLENSSSNDAEQESSKYRLFEQFKNAFKNAIKVIICNNRVFHFINGQFKLEIYP